MDNCPLCCAALRWWDRTEPTRCPQPPKGCGATILPSGEATPTLFSPEPEALARNTDPDTSHAAAKALGGKAGTMRRRLLRSFLTGDLTAEEAAEYAGYKAEDGAWKRVSDIQNAKLIEPTGDTRPGRSGRQQRVLRITALGRAALR